MTASWIPYVMYDEESSYEGYPMAGRWVFLSTRADTKGYPGIFWVDQLTREALAWEGRELVVFSQIPYELSTVGKHAPELWEFAERLG